MIRKTLRSVQDHSESLARYVLAEMAETRTSSAASWPQAVYAVAGPCQLIA